MVRTLGYPLTKTDRYVSKDTPIELSMAAGTVAGAEKVKEVSPPAGYAFAIRYFRLVTPLEMVGNILVTGLDGVESRLLYADQDEDRNVVHDASDWDSFFIYCRGFKLFGKAKVDLTADRVMRCLYSGGLVRV